MSTIDDFNYASKLWEDLLNRFLSLSCSHLHEIKTKLHHVSKTGSMNDCLKRIKDLIDRLAAAGDKVKYSNIVFYTLNGLPHEYNPFKSTIRIKGFPTKFAKLSSLLEAEEINLSVDNNLVLQLETIVLSAWFQHQASYGGSKGDF